MQLLGTAGLFFESVAITTTLPSSTIR